MLQLRKGEKIVLEVRRHWMAILGNVIGALFIAAIPFISLGIFRVLGLPIFVGDLDMSLFIFLSSCWLLLVWTVFYVSWTNYYLDVVIITNERLVDVEQKGLFSRNVAELRWENLEDVTVDVSGLLATLFDFGTIHAQTAAAAKEFVMFTMPHPYKVKEVISHQYELHRKQR